jgi:tetratricopeptide (TPR) repeat protein
MDDSEPNIASIGGEVHTMWENFEERFQLLDIIANVINPNNSNNAIVFQTCGETKRMLKDYQGTLEDFDKVNVLEPNNVFTLKTRGIIKSLLNDYKKTFKDLNETYLIKPNNIHVLEACGKFYKLMKCHEHLCKT